MLDKRHERHQLRKSLRERRRALSVTEQELASKNIVRLLRQQLFFIRAKSVAIYWPYDGEVSILDFALNQQMHHQHNQEKSWLLPILSNVVRPWLAPELYFQSFSKNSLLRPNQYGIPEPKFTPCNQHDSSMLDVVLLPLVGFDRSGNRLGMGKGYYDRTFRSSRTTWRKPRLIGIAHSIQEVDQIGHQSWDIPLTAIVTEKELIVC